MAAAADGRTRMERARGYDPEPLDPPPLFQAPPKLMGMVRWFVVDFMFPQTIVWIGVAIVAYRYFTPGLDRFATLSADDIGILWLRNVLLMLVIIGGQHWWLHIRKAQGIDYKYESRWLAKNRKSFTFNNQTRDNMFWSLVSGGGIAAVYEAGMFRMYATDSIPQVSSLWAVVAMMFALFWVDGLHFYVIHRLLHIDPLYRWAHALHHRNVNTGPWSGISMHPLEHVLYFSLPLVLLFLPGSPFLVTFALLYLMMTPSTSHSGFDRFEIGEDTTIAGGNYFHNLHHRYFEVNYGIPLVPLDQLFGTFHDGSVEAHEKMKDRRRAS